MDRDLIHPDNWVVLKVTFEDKSTYRVLAGWSGSYLYGSSWRLNSGITKCEETDHTYIFHGNSGSKYECHKNSYGFRMNNIGVYNQMKEKYGDAMELIPEETKWAELDYHA